MGSAAVDVALGCIGVGLLSKVDKLRDIRNASAAAGGIRGLLGQPRMVKHHIFNVFRGNSAGSAKYRDFFSKHGIDIDAYAVEVTEGFHRNWIHRAGRNWTTAWKRWIDNNPNATTREVYQQAGKMMDEYGLSDLPIVRYR